MVATIKALHANEAQVEQFDYDTAEERSVEDMFDVEEEQELNFSHDV